MRLFLIIPFFLIWKSFSPQPDRYVDARNNMVKSQIMERGITNSSTIAAMKKVPRHLFVPKDSERDAYGDYPMPIGYEQTISQPY